ncbi:MAG: glycosyltransferase family 2 protein [Acidobacteria bacterium]|nr:glycosyltransferase family 2 protein [Acidobacteriota bacterium]
MDSHASIAVIILTYNESRHLPRALASISGFAQEVIVVDSFSTDDTVAIAKAAGTTVVQHPFLCQAQQFNWALDNVPITSDWIMRLDADEIIESDLADEIVRRLPLLPFDITGINLNRKTIFQGRFIRHGGRYPLTMLRIWRSGKARVEDRWMDEHIYLTEGNAVTFKGGFADHNLNDLTSFTEKHNKYAGREALDVLNRRHHFFEIPVELTRESTAKQAKVKRFLKENVYNRVPFELSAFAYFFLRYVIQLGFLDGREGLIYHVLQGFWYRFLVGAKLREMETAIHQASTIEERRSVVARFSRQDLN